jgi:hypothetical protein
LHPLGKGFKGDDKKGHVPNLVWSLGIDAIARVGLYCDGNVEWAASYLGYSGADTASVIATVGSGGNRHQDYSK